MSTSGSTGSPKLVKLSSKNISSNATNIAKYLQINKSEIAISSLPFHQAYGLSILNSHLEVGAKILLTDLPITDKEFWKLFKLKNVTSLAGVPTTWRILKGLKFERMLLPNLNYVTQAGGKLDTSEIKWLTEIAISNKFKLFIMYGMTEATARISYYEPILMPSKIGSIGKSIPNGKIGIIDHQGKKINKSNCEGELIYEGPNVMKGYAENLSDLENDRDMDYLRTGDLGYFDDEKFFWLTGRIKRFIKISGYRFNLDDIEEFLRDQGFYSAVFGKDDNLSIAIIDKEINKEFLKNLLSKRYKINFNLIKIFLIKEFPKSASGKILYGKLKENLIN